MEEKTILNKQTLSVEEKLVKPISMGDEFINSKSQKGGLITLPFIIVNESLEKVASYGLMPNMIMYLMKDYNIGVAKGTNMLFLWSAATNFLPIVGAFVADSYLGRFLTIGFGSIASLLGMGLLWLTAMIPHVRPSPCNIFIQTCNSPSPSQMTLLVISFALISIGAGGVRPCTLAFGADQVDKRDNPNSKRALESFFNWYYASASFSVLIALTGIVYIQDHLGWKVGFGVPAILMFVAIVFFFLASSLYVKQKTSTNMFTGFVQVLVAAHRNRKSSLPPPNSAVWFYNKNSDYVAPTEKLRFLNKACLIRNAEEDVKPDGLASNPWSLCTVEKVEELKALIKVIPIWSSGLVMSINVSQTTFPLLQANSMDRHLTSKFEVPAGSFGMFLLLSLVIWILIYDRAILPLASKIRGKPVRIGVKERMGAGLVFSCLGMVVSAIVENIRRRKAIKAGFTNDPQAVLKMSAFWLVPQHSLNGLAEALNAIGQTEFYYSEFPKTMSSIGTSLFGLGMAVANLLATVILTAVSDITSRGGKESWVSNNINNGHYENYYWLLAILSFVNILYYLLCSWAYGPCLQQEPKVTDEQISSELSSSETGPKKEGNVSEKVVIKSFELPA